mgnify:CR=1 FL=1
MSILEVNHIKKVYKTRMGGEAVTALRDVHFSVEPGEFVAIMGESGSGKTTLLNILASLDTPTAGKVLVDGKDFTTLKDNERAIFRRSNLGFIFQDFNLLDNFSIEDNIKLPLVLAGEDYKKMDAKVEKAAGQLGIVGLLKKYPYEVSGGQKQRIAIAGVLAMKPDCIVLDEPTAMLDPVGRRDVMETIERLNKEEGITVILITHYMDEAVRGDKVYVIDDGDLVMKGTPREIFVQVEKLKEYGLDVPQVTEVTYLLRKEGIDLPADILTVEEMVGALCQFN